VEKPPEFSTGQMNYKSFPQILPSFTQVFPQIYPEFSTEKEGFSTAIEQTMG